MYVYIYIYYIYAYICIGHGAPASSANIILNTSLPVSVNMLVHKC